MKMKRSRTIGFAAIMLCVLGVSQAIADPAKETPPVKGGPIVEGFQVTAQTAEEHYTPMTPIVFTISFCNTTDKPLTFVATYVNAMYKFEVTDEKGKAIPFTRFGQSQLNGVRTFFGIGTEELSPGDEQKDEVIINRYFDMTVEGTYFVKFTRLMVPKLDKSGITTAESNTVEVVVHPSFWLPKRGE